MISSFRSTQKDTSKLEGQLPHPVRHGLQDGVDLVLEPLGFARLALHMLYEPTQRTEMSSSGNSLGALVYLVAVDGTVEVRIQCVDALERFVTERAFPSAAVEGTCCRPGLEWRRVGSVRAPKKTTGIRDDVVTIHGDNEAVYCLTSHAGGTSSGFTVSYERTGGDKGFGATWTLEPFRLMYGGAQVVLEIAF